MNRRNVYRVLSLLLSMRCAAVQAKPLDALAQICKNILNGFGPTSASSKEASPLELHFDRLPSADKVFISEKGLRDATGWLKNLFEKVHDPSARNTALKQLVGYRVVGMHGSTSLPPLDGEIISVTMTESYRGSFLLRVRDRRSGKLFEYPLDEWEGTFFALDLYSKPQRSDRKETPD